MPGYTPDRRLLGSEVGTGLLDKVPLDFRPEETEAGSYVTIWGKDFQAQGIISKKALQKILT